MLDAELGAPQFHDRAPARGHESHGDAVATQQADAHAVLRMEGLELASVAVVDQASVGQGAIDVEAHQADGGGTGEKIG